MLSRILRRWFASRRIKISQATRRRRLLLEPLENRSLLATFLVTNTDDGGDGSLRSAMIDANNTTNVGGPDRIEFNIPGSGVHTIFVAAAPGEPFSLPVIHDPVIIDGYTQGQATSDPSDDASPNTLAVGDNAVLKIEINGSLLTGGTRLFVFGGSGSGSTVRGLAITHVPYACFQFSEFGADAADGNTIVGNFIGTDAGGLTYQGGGPAILSVHGSNNHIGGPDPADRNVIAPDSFVFTASISMGTGTGTVIQGNYIGVNKDGDAPLQSPSGGFAIEIGGDSHSNIIGGTGPGEGNVIFATLTGIKLTERSGGHNVVQGNLLGTNATGTAGLGGGQTGIDIQTSSDTITGNVISGFSTGIVLSDQSHTGPGPTIQGNKIGTDVTGTLAIPNSGDGISVLSTPPGATTIGGTNPGDGNTIAFNGRFGVFVNFGTGCSILGNSIFANGNLGINLNGSSDGFTGPVTPNDPGDGDGDANGLQNYPVITSATSGGAHAFVTGTLNSTASTTFRLEFFASGVADPSGYGEGERYFGFGTVTTDASGNGSFDSASFATPLGASTAGEFISATATDPAGNTSEFSLVWIVVQGAQAPVANDDVYSVSEDDSLAPAAPGVLGNDTDADGNPLTAILMSGPTHGGLRQISDGSFIYTPAANYNGPDSFTYKANDGAADSNVAAVSITVTPVNDAPVATDGSLPIGEDIGDAGTLVASDVDSAALTYSLVDVSNAHGTVEITDASTGEYLFIPAPNYIGPASFTFKANDGALDSNVATVLITVAPINDAPVAADGTLNTAEDTGAMGTLVASDIDSGGLFYSLVNVSNAHGTVDITNTSTGAYSYTPSANYNGPASFTFKAKDGLLDSNVATVSITVTPVNDAPVATNGSLAIGEDIGDPGTLVASDIDSVALTYSLVDLSDAHGTVEITDASTGDYLFTPAPNYIGPASFTFKASDGALDSNVATVSITVSPLNDAPVAADGSLNTAEDTGATGTLVATDIDSPALTYSLVDLSDAHGTAVITNASTGAYSYAPAPNYSGPASFTFKANDGARNSNVATVSITVTPVNDAPVAVDGSLITDKDTGATGTLVTSDVDSAALTFSLVDVSNAHGTVVITNDSTGAYSYTPAANYDGPARFTFKANDGARDSNVATVYIGVIGNHTPAAVDDVVFLSAGTSMTINVLANDFDPDGDTLTVTAVTQPAGHNGIVTINHANGTLTYTQRVFVSGTETFTYTISDGHDRFSTATVTVNLSATVGVILLQEQVQAAGLSRGAETSLLQKLRIAQIALDRGDTHRADNALTAFANQVRAFKRAGILDFDDADLWLLEAANISAEIGRR